MADVYNSISDVSVGEFKDRGSKFIAYACPASTPGECLLQLENIRKEHPKARHHCYAWRLGNDRNAFRTNDDGEPSGTAGKPILGQIDKAGLSDIIVIVVRYFGGTLLGTSGLIHAYRESAAEAISGAVIVEKLIVRRLQVVFDYAIMSDVMNAVKKLKTTVEKQTFDASGLIVVAIPESEVPDWLLRFSAAVAQVSLEEAALMEKIPGLEIEEII